MQIFFRKKKSEIANHKSQMKKLRRECLNFLCLYGIISERISDAEVEAQAVEDGGDIVVGVDGLVVVGFPFLVIAVGLVRCVDADAYIEANDESVDIESQTGTRAEGDLFGEVGVIEQSVIQFRSKLHTLHIIIYAFRFEYVSR